MASPTTKTITVPIALDSEILVKQLKALRLLASHIGFALDTAILALQETAHIDGIEVETPVTLSGQEPKNERTVKGRIVRHSDGPMSVCPPHGEDDAEEVDPWVQDELDRMD